MAVSQGRRKPGGDLRRRRPRVFWLHNPAYGLLGVGSQVAEGRVTDQSPSSLSALWLCTLDEEATWRSWGLVSWFLVITPVPALRLSVS